MSRYQTIIGRAEQIDIVGKALGVPAKIDTGAYRSSIHASGIKIITKDGKPMLQFAILGHKNAPVKRLMEAEFFDEIEVRSSNGVAENRYEVKLKIKLANKLFMTSFSLADRSDNIFPVLIGRTALVNRYHVDVSRSGVKMEKLLKEFGIEASDY